MQPFLRQPRRNTNTRRDANTSRNAPRQKKAPVRTGPFLWNPKVAVVLSLVFTPVFGAAVHALNWRTLKEDRLARQSLFWSLAGVAILLISPLTSLFLAHTGETRTANAYTVTLLFVYLISWLLLEAPRQTRYMRERLPRTYNRQPWTRILLMTLAACVAYLLVGFLLSWLTHVAR